MAVRVCRNKQREFCSTLISGNIARFQLLLLWANYCHSPPIASVLFCGSLVGKLPTMACCHRMAMALEHFSIRLGIARVCEISFAFFFGNPFEKSGDCSPKLLNSARLHFA